ncbi:dTDP-4-dehydrorhamnose reductase [Pelagibacterium luteolum]|uniref:dTDP-4-dehydrorhamnose reductase n=1 Tax=Pelagibacterium luteolum TaxID=440168 RepID=A0A1G7XWN2_9HYPH|nr:dTDP-4-dehydrorhamnose reductase [Pelagibacterium luteolum]SDG88426.1 dTDP-4-dehydrorhamnose reductase [Pelagibacterium luteolum]
MKLLVTGRDGQVAQALSKCASDTVEIVCVGRPELDLLDPASIKTQVEAHRPDVVINPAAYTAVDKAESEPELACAINRDGAGYVAEAAARIGVPIIQISTDYVFRGDKPSPYTEDDATDPQGAYGASKLAGEQAVAAANPTHSILRTAWVYAPWGNNFAKTMLRLAGDRDVVRVVADQHGTPTYAPDIADGILAVARKMLAEKEASDWRGVFHMTNSGATSWAGFAEEIFARSSERGGASAGVEPITTADYPTPAKRPANSRLHTAKFTNVFSHTLPDWREGVIRFCDQAHGKTRD